MKKLLAFAVIAIVLAGLPSLALASEKAVEGTIQSVNPADQTLTLSDGMKLTVPTRVSTESIHPGEDVTITYHNDGNGDRLATAIWIDGLNDGQS